MRVAILGSGIIGLFTAYFLKKEGVDVVIIEKETRPAGATMGNAGMLVPSHFMPLAAPGVIQQGLKWMMNSKSPFYIKPRLSWDLVNWGFKFMRASRSQKLNERTLVLRDIGLASRALYSELLNENALKVAFKEKGLFMHCRTEKAFDEEAEIGEKALKLGIQAEILSGKQAQKIDSGCSLDVFGSVYYPGDAFLSPSVLVNSLLNYLKEQGVEFRFGEEYENAEFSENRISTIYTNRGSISADEFVLASGAWSSVIGKSIGLKIPMQPGKGYSFTLSEPPYSPNICSILVEERIAVTPMGKNLRFGGTMEMSGFDNKINDTRVDGIRRAIPKYFPEFNEYTFSENNIWYGYRPCSPDGLPYIGRSGKYKNLSIATGHAMLGLSLAPVTGQMIKEVIVNGVQPHQLLSPDRYI